MTTTTTMTELPASINSIPEVRAERDYFDELIARRDSLRARKAKALATLNRGPQSSAIQERRAAAAELVEAKTAAATVTPNEIQAARAEYDAATGELSILEEACELQTRKLRRAEYDANRALAPAMILERAAFVADKILRISELRRIALDEVAWVAHLESRGFNPEMFAPPVHTGNVSPDGSDVYQFWIDKAKELGYLPADWNE